MSPSNPQRLADYFGKPTRNDNIFSGKRKPILLVLLVFAVVSLLVGFSFSERLKPGTTRISAAKRDAEPVDAEALFGKDSDEALVAVQMEPKENLPVKLPVEPPGEPKLEIFQSPGPVETFPQQMLDEQQRLKAQWEAEQRSTEQAALKSQITAYTNPEYEKALPKIQKTEKESIQARIENSKLLSENYLATTRVQPISPFEVKAGAVIPAIMLSGINSQLPGQILAQVAENVYDTASGSHLMIPQGSRVVGQYLNNVNTGQDRVIVFWQRIIYPDGSSLNIKDMQGMDPSGYTGFKDKTNNHHTATFGKALLMSIFTAGAQLAQPIPRTGTLAYTPQQVATGAMSQQMTMYGMTSMNQGTHIPPTITIRPGYRFNIMVSKDMVMEPWRADEHPLHTVENTQT